MSEVNVTVVRPVIEVKLKLFIVIRVMRSLLAVNLLAVGVGIKVHVVGVASMAEWCVVRCGNAPLFTELVVFAHLLLRLRLSVDWSGWSNVGASRYSRWAMSRPGVNLIVFIIGLLVLFSVVVLATATPTFCLVPSSAAVVGLVVLILVIRRVGIGVVRVVVIRGVCLLIPRVDVPRVRLLIVKLGSFSMMLRIPIVVSLPVAVTMVTVVTTIVNVAMVSLLHVKIIDMVRILFLLVSLSFERERRGCLRVLIEESLYVFRHGIPLRWPDPLEVLLDSFLEVKNFLSAANSGQ